ncbi:MAG: hypothetical protein JWO94_1887, partial [Verrucomicrobiaceae bacterium]|nr:hypothetical protein [Verrucomicrobiaceae bacterium]
KKYGSIFAGVLWMVFMGRSAIQNRGRSIRCDDKSVFISQPFGLSVVPVHEICKITRNDVRKKFREINELGMSRRQKFERMDTMAATVVYTFYNAGNEELLRLDSNMQPPREMQRFLRRMERQTGTSIVEE